MILYKAIFPITKDMSPTFYIVYDEKYETKEQMALSHYNNSREHDNLRPLAELPNGVKFI